MADQRQGTSEYLALAVDVDDPERLREFAVAEERRLEVVRADFPRNEVMQRNYELLVASNGSGNDTMPPEVHRRLLSVVRGTKASYGSADEWAEKLMESHREGILRRVPREEIDDRVRGFAITALHHNDLKTLETTLLVSRLQRDPAITDAINERMAKLEGSDASRDREIFEELARIMVTPRAEEQAA
ncbi:MAG: hypothetical protein V1907_04725 [Candidatus Kerfeldbacteria bacterium]